MYTSCIDWTATRSKAENLQHSRHGHGAILIGEQVLIIGGNFGQGFPVAEINQIKNEVCTFRGSEMTCVELPPSLEDYAYYPELFLVAEDYGNDKTKC